MLCVCVVLKSTCRFFSTLSSGVLSSSLWVWVEFRDSLPTNRIWQCCVSLWGGSHRPRFLLTMSGIPSRRPVPFIGTSTSAWRGPWDLPVSEPTRKTSSTPVRLPGDTLMAASWQTQNQPAKPLPNSWSSQTDNCLCVELYVKAVVGN